MQKRLNYVENSIHGFQSCGFEKLPKLVKISLVSAPRTLPILLFQYFSSNFHDERKSAKFNK